MYTAHNHIVLILQIICTLLIYCFSEHLNYLYSFFYYITENIYIPLFIHVAYVYTTKNMYM